MDDYFSVESRSETLSPSPPGATEGWQQSRRAPVGIHRSGEIASPLAIVFLVVWCDV